MDMPTASYLKSDVILPSYLSYWLRLRTISDVDKYVAIRRKTRQAIKEYGHYNFSERQAIETRAFYEALKRERR